MAKRKKAESEGGQDDDRPWDEERWEAFMRESDLRSARYGEILETVMDDPNRDRIIAREMGWEWLEEALDDGTRPPPRGKRPAIPTKPPPPAGTTDRRTKVTLTTSSPRRTQRRMRRPRTRVRRATRSTMTTKTAPVGSPPTGWRSTWG